MCIPRSKRQSFTFVLGIFFAVSKLSVPQLRKAVEEMDESILTADRIKNMIKLCPTVDEVSVEI